MAGYVDADGHVIEDPVAIHQYLEAPFDKMRTVLNVLPDGDKFHSPSVQSANPAPGAFEPADAKKWTSFMDMTGTDWAVLYPTRGLFYGRIVFEEWAIAYARAYNNWLHDTFIKENPRLRGICLLPMQVVDEAVAELRRCVRDLGMVGGMIPSNGLIKHIASREYWPLYQEAQELGCVLAVHGGNYERLGFDTMSNFPASRALGMPIPLLNGLTGMIVDGVLDRFPDLHFGFMEGGTAWIPLLIDRLEREMGYGGLELPHHPEDYFRRGQVFIGCEGNEKALSYAIERVGPDPFMFASDFPHEITIDNCMEEINEIVEREDIKEEHKMLILRENARNMYGEP